MTGYGADANIENLSGVVYSDLGLANAAALDTLITALNNQVAVMINTYCRRDFNTHTAAEVTQRADNSFVMTVPHRPIISITSITENKQTVDSDTYFIRQVPGSSSLAGAIERLYRWWTKQSLYVITYNWGYASPPADVVFANEQIAISILQGMVQRQRTGNAQSVSFGGYSVSYAGLTDHQTMLMEALSPYRQVVV